MMWESRKIFPSSETWDIVNPNDHDVNFLGLFWVTSIPI